MKIRRRGLGVIDILLACAVGIGAGVYVWKPVFENLSKSATISPKLDNQQVPAAASEPVKHSQSQEASD